MSKWYERIINAHLSVTDAVSHGERLKSDRYFVWMEDGSNDLEAGGGHTERAVTGHTDLFSKVEFDPWADALGEALSSGGIAWQLVSVEFDAEANVFHWSWDWEVPV